MLNIFLVKKQKLSTTFYSNIYENQIQSKLFAILLNTVTQFRKNDKVKAILQKEGNDTIDNSRELRTAK